MGAGSHGRHNVDRVRTRSLEQKIEARSAARLGFGYRKLVPVRNRIERLRKSARLRSIRQRDVDFIPGETACVGRARLKFRPDGDFRFVLSDFLRCRHNLRSDFAKLALAK